MKTSELFKEKTVFVGSWTDLMDIPFYNRPEICFVGRSNVGKSSLINALTGIAGLAKTSSTPGRTQTINLFDYIGKLTITDLPGYGYAKASKKMADNWNRFTKIYLSGRVDLRRVFLLMDSRQRIMGSDYSIMGLLDASAVPYQIVFTKADKNSAKEKDEAIASVEGLYKKHPAMLKEVLFTSSEKKIGIDELKSQIMAVMS
jgi:GTP-binding protein